MNSEKNVCLYAHGHWYLTMFALFLCFRCSFFALVEWYTCWPIQTYAVSKYLHIHSYIIHFCYNWCRMRNEKSKLSFFGRSILWSRYLLFFHNFQHHQCWWQWWCAYTKPFPKILLSNIQISLKLWFRKTQPSTENNF